MTLSVKYMVFLCTLVLAIPALAGGMLNGSNRHTIRISADFSYARDFDMSDAVLLSSNGFAPSLGMGYRGVFNHFALDLGLGVQYRNVVNHPDSILQIAEAVDSEGYTYMGTHTWTNRSSRAQKVSLQLPLMLGTDWERWFVLAGVKVNMSLWARNRDDGYYSLVADYERYIDPFNDMAPHGFVTDEYYSSATGGVEWGGDLRVCAEVGCHVWQNLSVSVFGEYGVVLFKGNYHPLEVGARLSYLFTLKVKRKERCMCELDEWEW